MRNNENPGYRLGRIVRHVLMWHARMTDKARQRGIPRWVIKIPALLILTIITGLLLTGAIFMALFIILMIFIGIFLVNSSEGLRDKDIMLNGFHYNGPEGPGWYEMGVRIKDEEGE